MNNAGTPSDWVGRVIDGKFKLLQWLGGSERTPVFLTELAGDPPRKAAIRFVPVNSVDAETRLEAWEATANLTHPHLMPVIQTGHSEIDGTLLLYAVTEHAEEVLAEIVQERPLTADETREMLDPILEALSYLHAKGFVHGHLKPSNIMVVDNQIKISGDSLCIVGKSCGRIASPTAYDAPETATEPMSPSSDVWSVGVTLVHALTQHPPMWDGSKSNEPVVPKSIPQPFAKIARDCLSSDPARRCTLSDIKGRLRPAPSTSVPESKVDRAATPRFRVMPIVIALLVLIAIIVVLRVRNHSTSTTSKDATQQSAPESSTQPATPGAGEPSASETPSTQPPKPSASQQRVPDAPAAQSPPAPKPVPATSSVPSAPAPQASSSQPEVVERVMPDVPPRASATIQGRVQVKVRVAVDASGNVADASLESPGPSKYFANLALQAARKWRFKPAQAGSSAAPSAWILHFEFRRGGVDVTPVAASH
jgi:TonB family protein